LLGRASEERSRQELRAAAAEDEDVEVRWIARYALRLADRGGHPPQISGEVGTEAEQRRLTTARKDKPVRIARQQR
jgi:hypothetical protein